MGEKRGGWVGGCVRKETLLRAVYICVCVCVWYVSVCECRFSEEGGVIEDLYLSVCICVCIYVCMCMCVTVSWTLIFSYLTILTGHERGVAPLVHGPLLLPLEGAFLHPRRRDPLLLHSVLLHRRPSDGDCAQLETHPP